MARRSSRGGRVLDFKQWLSLPSLEATFSTDGNIGGSALAFVAPATILRIRGSFFVQFDSTAQVGDNISVAVGIGIVSTDAAALGATALPDPASELEYPWLWWGSMNLASEVAAAPTAWGPGAQFMEVDTKAMRRVKPQQSLALIVEVFSATGAPVTLLKSTAMRVLVGT